MNKYLIIGGIIIVGVGFLVHAPSKEIKETQIPEITIGAITPVTIDNTTFTVSDLRFASTTEEDEEGNEINKTITGLVIPIRVATSTGFIDEEYVMNFDGYNQCRGKGKTKAICIGELNDDIQQNIVTFRLNKLQEMREQKAKDFEDEINLTDL